jgi:hypothetical protein
MTQSFWTALAVAAALAGCDRPTVTMEEAVHLAITDYTGAFNGCIAQYPQSAQLTNWAYCSYVGRLAEDKTLRKVNADPHNVRVHMSERVLSKCVTLEARSTPMLCLGRKPTEAEALVTAEDYAEAAQARCVERGGPGVEQCVASVEGPAFEAKIKELGVQPTTPAYKAFEPSGKQTSFTPEVLPDYL